MTQGALAASLSNELNHCGDIIEMVGSPQSQYNTVQGACWHLFCIVQNFFISLSIFVISFITENLKGKKNLMSRNRDIHCFALHRHVFKAEMPVSM